jgi:hypothetical protein
VLPPFLSPDLALFRQHHHPVSTTLKSMSFFEQVSNASWSDFRGYSRPVIGDFFFQPQEASSPINYELRLLYFHKQKATPAIIFTSR